MSYEYKEEILLDIGPEPNCNYESEFNRYYDKIDELDHVYARAARAAKADEYEAKAEAFDEIFKLYIGYEDGWNNYPKGRMSFYKEIINVCKSYESGGSDE